MNPLRTASTEKSIWAYMASYEGYEQCIWERCELIMNIQFITLILRIIAKIATSKHGLISEVDGGYKKITMLTIIVFLLVAQPHGTRIGLSVLTVRGVCSL